MCGIAGLLGWRYEHAEAEATAERLGKAIRHRGPDDWGYHLDSEAGVTLVSTRLAIQDLSPAGHMPMHSQDGRWSIVFNGEIYNFLELRAELEAAGVRFRSHSDTEVVLELFQAHGPAFLSRLRGMFALAIWDNRERVAYLARDPLGIKPLYVHDAGDRVAFASEMRPLLAHPAIPNGLDPEGLRLYFLRGYVVEPRTLIKGIHVLEAGHVLEWTPGRGSRRWAFADVRDWMVEAARERRAQDAAEAAKALRAALDDSLRHHLISDVPVGIFLSGGLDSSAMLAALTTMRGNDRVGSFSIGFDMANLNEAPTARRVAETFGSAHHEQILTGSDALKLFDDYRASLDQPSVDGFNTYCVSRFAREHGYKVVLSGLGGDELFGGYPSFRRVPMMLQRRRLLSYLPGGERLVGGAMESWGRTPVQRRIGSFLQDTADLATAYGYFRGVFSDREAAALCQRFVPGAGEEAPPPTPVIGQHPVRRAATPREFISLFETTQYMRNQLLRDSDAMSMAHGLELRTPFVDRDFVKAVFRLAPDHRFQPHKGILPAAVPELPTWLLSLPKRGFTLPFQHWINNEWRAPFDDLFARYPLLRRDQAWSRSLVIYSLEDWIERNRATHSTAA